jgi:hypothetical protein
MKLRDNSEIKIEVEKDGLKRIVPHYLCCDNS